MKIDDYYGELDVCYECRSLGRDYHVDEYGELVSSCDACWINTRWDDYEEDY